MKNKIKDGITISEIVYIVEDQEAKSTWQVVLFQMLAVLMVVWSTVSVFIDCFFLPAKMIYIDLILLFATVGAYLFYHWKCNVLTKIAIITFTCGCTLYFKWEQFRNAFFIIENLVIEQCNIYFGFAIIDYKANYSTAIEDTTFLMAFIGVILIVILSISVISNKYKSVCYILMFLPIAASFLVGLMPKDQYLVIYIVSLIFITKVSSESHNSISKNQISLQQIVNYRVAVFLCIMILAFLGFMRVVVSPSNYQEVVRLEDKKKDIQTFLFDFSLEGFTDRFRNNSMPKLFGEGSNTGGLEGGKLGNSDHISFDGTEHLSVTVPMISISNGIYLKGYVGTEYKGDRWEGLTKKMKKQYSKTLNLLPDKEFALVNISNLLFENLIKINDAVAANLEIGLSSIQRIEGEFMLYQGKMKVEYLEANKNFFYAPYYTDFTEQDNIEYQQDLYAAPAKKQNKYEFNYYFSVSIGEGIENFLNADFSNWTGEYMELEKTYRSYVYDIYTRLPSEGLDQLTQEFSQAKEEYEVGGLIDCITFVKNYLQSNTEYTLSPGELPKGKDFVEYFLYENHKGYCAHYASAATLMLRAMGVPARYVEGYSINASDIARRKTVEDEEITWYSEHVIIQDDVNYVNVSVKDSNAHAWVEVYIDGCGWYPVEFTPGSNGYETSSVVDDALVHKPNLTTPTPTITPKLTPKIKKETDKKEVNNNSSKADKDKIAIKDKKEQKKQDILYFIVFTILLISFVSVIIKYLTFFNKKRKAKRTRNHSTKALLLYEEIEQLLKISSKEVAESEAYVLSLEIALKARFDKNLITLNELHIIEEFHSNIVKRAYERATFLQKVYIKLFFRVLIT